MKVFLSWSGNTSHQVALKLRDWLPSVIQVVEPYVSSEDIDKGARWSTDISRELEDSAFGILCVTKENINAPWLQFEAGALSKKLDKSYVSPFLFDIKRSEIKGPILQFQSTIIEEADILKLVKTINKACGDEQLKEERLVKIFEVWYPKLEDELLKIESPKIDEQVAKPVENGNTEILEEILELSRSNQRLLTSPDSILPPDYFNSILNKNRNLGRNLYNMNEEAKFLKNLDRLISQFSEMTSIYKAEGRVVDEEYEHMLLRIVRINDILQNNNRKVRIDQIL